MLDRNGNGVSKVVAMHSRPSALCSDWTAPADDSEQDYHDGDHQENMDQTAHRVGTHQPQEPQDEQNDGDGIEHGDILSWLNSNSPDREGPEPMPGRLWASDRGAALHKQNSPLRVAPALCAGVHTSHVSCASLHIYKVLVPCRSAAISPATRGGIAVEGN